MLAADKLQLQSALKQQATALKEKEFSLHHNNLMTVGTQAAVLAGLDITMFIEFSPPHNNEWGEAMALQTLARSLKMLYYGTIVAAFCANITVVAHTTALSVLGGGLALRGPDGSMMTATDVLYAERRSVFYVFGIGLGCTIGSVLVCVWIMLPWEAALVCWLVTLYTSRRMYCNYKRVQQALEFDDSQTVDFRDIFDGPANIRVANNYVYQNHRSRKSPPRKHFNDSSNSNNIHSNSNGSSSTVYSNGAARNNYYYSPAEDDSTTDSDLDLQRTPLVNNTAYYSTATSKSRRRNNTVSESTIQTV